MAYETRPGQGALFVNDKKQSEKHPDRKGNMVCPCCKADLWLSGWLKKSAAGKAWMSLEAQQKTAGEPVREADTKPADYSDDIPFAFAFLAPLAGLLAAGVYAQNLLQV